MHPNRHTGHTSTRLGSHHANCRRYNGKRYSVSFDAITINLLIKEWSPSPHVRESCHPSNITSYNNITKKHPYTVKERRFNWMSQISLHQHLFIYRSFWAQSCTVVLTVHVSFMLIFNECITPRFPRPLVVDYVNLEETLRYWLAVGFIRKQHAAQYLYTQVSWNHKTDVCWIKLTNKEPYKMYHWKQVGLLPPMPKHIFLITAIVATSEYLTVPWEVVFRVSLFWSSIDFIFFFNTRNPLTN